MWFYSPRIAATPRICAVAPGSSAAGGQSQEDIAINVGAGQMLYEAAADTGRLQIGEDQDVGSSGHFSDIFSEFSLGNIHHDGGISLQLSVKVGLDSSVRAL